MPKPDQRTKELFQSVLPNDSRVQAKPMFGQVAGFVNGNMFTGLYGNALFVRLPEEGRAELLAEDGAQVLEPMAGRPMREYVVLPEAWHAQPEWVQEWVQRSMNWTAGLPGKAEKKRKS